MKVVVISGPTASGKTDTSIELAARFGGEIINFDSLLLYKEITIGTAKPTPEEQKSIPHHMIDVTSIAEPLNAADYARQALPIARRLLEQGKLIYLVGGSGFYLQALLKGMYDSPTTPAAIIERSDKLYADAGITPFLTFLKECDPATYQRYHENDHYRIRRAVEHFWNTGVPLSEERARKDESNSKLESSSVHGWDVLHLHLDLPKEEHFQIIRKRTERMLKAGLKQEVEELLKSGFSGLEKPLQSIGYKEILDWHFGIFKNEDECRERINISTRQLAKAQRTWFNRIKDKQTFHPLLDKAQITKAVSEFIG